jgi:hypothetical protein
MYLVLVLLGLLLVSSQASDPVTGWKGYASDHRPIPDTERKLCRVVPDSKGGDDAPVIIQAFRECKENSHIILDGGTYHIQSPMNTTDLKDVKIDLNGKMIVSKDSSAAVSDVTDQATSGALTCLTG